MIYLPNGIGELLGDQLVTCSPLQSTGAVWYVQSTNGVDAVSPAGKDKERPLATLAQAITNAADNDIIVLLPLHAQVLITQQSIAKKLTIVGAGTTNGKPAVTIGCNYAAASILNVTVANVEFRNIRFTGSLLSTVQPKIALSLSGARVTGCYFECGALDQGAAVELFSGADQGRLTRCTFVSTATSLATRPGYGLRLQTSTVLDLELNDCVFDDGAYGFVTGAFVSTGTLTRIKAENLSMLNGADVVIPSASTGFVNVATRTGGGRVDW